MKESDPLFTVLFRYDPLLRDGLGVRCEREVFAGRKDGAVRKIRFSLRPHDSVILGLERGGV